jgi:hypothetical protein
MPRRATDSGKTVERQAREFFEKELGIPSRSLPPYDNAQEFAERLMREFAQPSPWIVSLSGSTAQEEKPA